MGELRRRLMRWGWVSLGCAIGFWLGYTAAMGWNLRPKTELEAVLDTIAAWWMVASVAFLIEGGRTR